MSFNRKLLTTVLCIWIAVGAKLFTTALATDNMRGFGYSMLHLIIVGAGSYYALRKPSTA